MSPVHLTELDPETRARVLEQIGETEGGTTAPATVEPLIISGSHQEREKRPESGGSVKITRQQKQAIKTLAEQLLVEHGLTDWKIRDANPRILGPVYEADLGGFCCPGEKTIFINFTLHARCAIEHPTVESAWMSILHEIAHAKTDCCGHDLRWAECALRLGLDWMEVMMDLSYVMYSPAAHDVQDAPAARIAFEAIATRMPDGMPWTRDFVRRMRDGIHETAQV